MPSDERVRLDDNQRGTPVKCSAQERHQPAGGIVGPSWPNFALLEERQLFPEEEVLRRQGDTRSAEYEHKPTEVDQHFAKGTEEMTKAQGTAG